MLRGVEQVKNFARRMVNTLNLPRNTVKPGWETMDLRELRTKLDEEYYEVVEALETIMAASYPTTMKEEVVKLHLSELERLLSEECTDLANICMMITDRVGGLDD